MEEINFCPKIRHKIALLAQLRPQAGLGIKYLSQLLGGGATSGAFARPHLDDPPCLIPLFGQPGLGGKRFSQVGPKSVDLHVRVVKHNL